MESIEQRFGRRLRLVREAHGDTQERIAQVCDVSRQQVYRWERGEGGPQARQLLRLLQHYRPDADYLVNGDPGEEHPLNAPLYEFLKTPIGVAAEAAGLTNVLSSIQFKDTPTVPQYREIALILLRDSGRVG